VRDIHNYIVQDNPAAATRIIEALYQKAEVLRKFPESGYRYWQRPDRPIRILLHGHYRIAYVVKSPAVIDILGVFHGALNIDRYLL
jgi:plasmid stabilization system protein ParE